MRKNLLAAIGLFLFCGVAAGQAHVSTSAVAQQSAPKTARAEVLVLGSYHMANPGRDIFNTQADDVLAPKRQAEIAQLLEVLKKFQPTKIAIESDPNGPRPRQYNEYLAGTYTLTRNEIDQIGFRLAKELGHKAIYPVDADGEFPYQRLVNYAKASGRSKELEAIMSEVGTEVKAQDQFLATHTILETLSYINAEEKVVKGHGLYLRMAHISEPWDWAGADLVSDWFRRNMRIFANIVRLADSPNERVLVVYGSGHLGWLQHYFANDPNFTLRKASDFAK